MAAAPESGLFIDLRFFGGRRHWPRWSRCGGYDGSGSGYGGTQGAWTTTTKIMANSYDTVGVADLADLGAAKGENNQTSNWIQNRYITAVCTAVVAEDRELRGAVAQEGRVASALFGDQEGLFHTPTQPKTRTNSRNPGDGR